jgi:ribosomal protein L10
MDHPTTHPPATTPATHTAPLVTSRRDLFWNNVVRDTLMALATAAAHSSGRVNEGPVAAAHSVDPVHDLFDGRMGVITTLGQRIPIADVFPVFACTALGDAQTRQRSEDVQCTVFRITTPAGEIYTLPVSQIHAIHTISEDLLRELEAQALAQENQDEDTPTRPFGFAAFTSLAKAESERSTTPNPSPES